MKKYIVIVAIVLVLLIMISKKSESEVISTFKTSQATINKVNTYQSLISNASQAHNIPVSRIKAHIAVESAGNPNANGSAGEVGLMQMKAAALQDVNKRFLSNAPLKLFDLYEAGYSIASGAAYLRILFEQLGTLDKASMAYNSGADNISSKKAKTYLEKILAYEKLL